MLVVYVIYALHNDSQKRALNVLLMKTGEAPLKSIEVYPLARLFHFFGLTKGNVSPLYMCSQNVQKNPKEDGQQIQFNTVRNEGLL